MPYSIFFSTVYIFGSLVIRAVFSVISVSVLSTPYLPPALALGMSPLLASETTLDLDPVVIEPGFETEAVYYYSLTG